MEWRAVEIKEEETESFTFDMDNSYNDLKLHFTSGTVLFCLNTSVSEVRKTTQSVRVRKTDFQLKLRSSSGTNKIIKTMLGLH